MKIIFEDSDSAALKNAIRLLEVDGFVTVNDPPAPTAPYEMLGEITITHDDCGSGFAHHIRLNGRVMTGGMSKGEENLFFPLIHEHACGREALELLQKDQKIYPDDSTLSDKYRLIAKQRDTILARLNAGSPEKGV